MDIQPECPHGCPEIENSTHVLLHCPHYSTARRELKHEIEKLKLPFDVPIQPECPHGCPEIENSTHVLLHCPHYSTARRELKHEIEKLKLPFDVPTLTGVNFSIPKHTQEKIAK
jgi:hypothetical protein